ncbi:hypothetical protein B9G69_000770 [Bdellovibrio sp. SKB1291214]|uniref:hypothetical protein n=1 Tax=Bdellovibrio sp. SKB1291214 TaxID=1732569 RepID=UPI000B51C593|nr:hypothetical protein [Bdellovibrio sp. SKB1291214]UYL09107.1 hypothetical protein B9G69_000770 [Bdellovibrio sp. SKB1291214]
MKILVFVLSCILSFSAFASVTSQQIDQICLDLLISDAANIPVDGDVHTGENLKDILASGLKKNSVGQYVNKITMTCHKISYDGVYECTLIMESQAGGVTLGETAVNYILSIAHDGVTPEKVLGRATIMRGH